MREIEIEGAGVGVGLDIVNNASQNLCFNDKQPENPPPPESICYWHTSGHRLQKTFLKILSQLLNPQMN